MTKLFIQRRSAQLIPLVLASLCLGFASVSAQTAAPKLTATEWQADLRFMTERMAGQHPNLYRRIKKEEFDAAVKQFNDQIPSLNDDQVIVGFMKIVALVHDGHTTFYPDFFFHTGIYPLRLYQYTDGLYVSAAAPEYAGLVGAKVLRVGNYSADEAIKLTEPLAFADNKWGVRQLSPFLLPIPTVVAGLKITDDKQTLKLVVQVDGKEKTFLVKPAFSLNDLIKPPSDWVSADAGVAAPLYRQHPNDIYWFEYLKEQKLLYVQQNEVGNKPDETVADFYHRVMEFAAANPVDKFVLDLRNNGGGNNFLNRPVVIDLIKSKLDVRGHLFVIIGRGTFSAAQNFVNELEKYTQAIFVGEPTSEHPNLYGDNRPITLPNSKLEVRVSTLYWQDVDPRDTRSWTAPEIAAEVSSDDFRNGRDPALQAVIEYVPGSSFQDLLNEAKAQTDVRRTFAAKYRSFKADPKHRYVETEIPMNLFGYALLQDKRPADAVEIFKLNAESFPGSANAFDSLGDGFQAMGNREDAIKSYEKALAIDPNFPSSVAQLKKLKPAP